MVTGGLGETAGASATSTGTNLISNSATGHWLGLPTMKAAIAIPNLLDARKGANG